MTKDFIGLSNYREVLQDPLFYNAVINTFIYVLFDGAGVVVFGLLLGIVLNVKLKGQGLFRTVFYVPVVVDWVIVATVWMFILDPSFGLANYLLKEIGFAPQKFLQSTEQALPIIIASSIWKGVGYYAIFYLAALQDIPDHLYEAGKIDGANRLQLFWNITLPQLAPVSLFVVIMATIGALKGFDQFYIMTQGGPARSTNTIMFYFYETAFGHMKMGLGATIAILFTFLVFLIVVFQRLVLNRMSGASGSN